MAELRFVLGLFIGFGFMVLAFCAGWRCASEMWERLDD